MKVAVAILVGVVIQQGMCFVLIPLRAKNSETRQPLDIDTF